tara:strand:- start:1826 stop:2146 length:321 start_codon:yes stop_codon:yes gene_type:complete
MPYTKDELTNPQSNIYTFYSALSTKDETKYLEQIEKKTEGGDLSGGVLRDKKDGKIILFEKIIPGQGTDESSHPFNHTITVPVHGYFDYEESEDINKIIDREFTEL